MSTAPAPAAGPGRWGLGDVAAGILASMALTVLVGGAIAALAGWEETDQVPMWGQALLQLPLWGGYLGAVVVAGRVKGAGVVAEFGLSQRALDVPVGLLLGIVTQLVVLPVVYLPILWLTGTDSDELSAPARELADRAGTPLGWIVFALVVGVGAPVVEELFYRGLFLRALTKAGAGTVAAVVASSVVFAAVHLQLLQFPGLAIFGLLAAVLTVRTGRLGPAIWAHVGFNLTTVVVLYLGS